MDKIFAKLSFQNFCAGELEIITRAGIKNEEREARLEILKTLCYHHNYLDMTEIRSLYAATMQKVERGVSQWNCSLAERLHNDLAFRASVTSREKEKEKQAAEKSKMTTPGSNSGSKKESKGAGVTDKIHFCGDYNKGSCIFEDHHPGKINGKDTYLYHVCVAQRRLVPGRAHFLCRTL